MPGKMSPISKYLGIPPSASVLRQRQETKTRNSISESSLYQEKNRLSRQLASAGRGYGAQPQRRGGDTVDRKGRAIHPHAIRTFSPLLHSLFLYVKDLNTCCMFYLPVFENEALVCGHCRDAHPAFVVARALSRVSPMTFKAGDLSHKITFALSIY